MISSQNIDVKELTSIVYSANDLGGAWPVRTGGAAADRGVGRDLTEGCRGIVILVSWLDLCQGKHLEWN